jgi:hypothetical protein
MDYLVQGFVDHITSRGDNFRFSDKHLDERDQQRTDTTS